MIKVAITIEPKKSANACRPLFEKGDRGCLLTDLRRRNIHLDW